MRILITGATGLVGRRITSLCHERGYVVHYLTTRKSKLEINGNYRGFHWDPANGEIDTACFDGVQAIINLAGAPVAQRWTEENRKEIIDSRVKSLEVLKNGLEQVSHENIDVLVSASAIGIYPSSESAFYTEDEKAVDDGFLGQVVQQWEAAADAFDPFGFPVSKIRIGLVLSMEGGALPPIVRAVNGFVGAAFGSGKQWQSWIHIEDVARIMLYAVEQQLGGIFNAVAPNPVIQEKLVQQVSSVLKKPLILPNIPAFALRLLLGDMSQIILASQRVCNKKITSYNFEFNYVNLAKALEDILGQKKAMDLSRETT